jgi:hydrogenase nickel incorporation protein HypA/HybF
MHELSIALSIIDVAGEEAERQGAGKVHAVHLKLGPLSGVVKEALLGAFELAREGTPLAQASLIIEDIPVRGHCPRCDAEADVVSIQEVCCAACGTPIARLVSGREMEVFALEIES